MWKCAIQIRFTILIIVVQESKDSLKLGLDGIDRTMPFFSPAATSTVGRPGKVPPPVPPKANSFDDSYSRTDVVSGVFLLFVLFCSVLFFCFVWLLFCFSGRVVYCIIQMFSHRCYWSVL